MRADSRFVTCGLAWLVALGVVNLGCGDSLSSLETVQRGSRKVYSMVLSPDFGRRGDTLTVEVVGMDDELNELLTKSVAYPTEISFGEGIFIKTFGTSPDELLQIEVFVSPLAKKGERTPTLVFSIDGKLAEARGSFFVLPAQPE